jgi:Zn-dependent membrane protease YugP
MATLGTGTVIHALTLPTEFDASFGRALPLLRKLGVLLPGDEAGARRILTAAALTYVAASLMSLLNIARWWAIIRR